MVVGRDIRGKGQIIVVRHALQHLANNVSADRGVLLHLLELLRGQAPGFAQDLVGDHDLPDVVHRREGRHLGNELFVQLIAVDPVPDRVAGQHLDEDPGPQHVFAGLDVAVLDQARKPRDDVALHPRERRLIRDQRRLDVLLDQIVVIDVAETRPDRDRDIGDVEFEDRHGDDPGDKDHKDHRDRPGVAVAELPSDAHHTDDQVHETDEIERLVDEKQFSARIPVRPEREHPPEGGGDRLRDEIGGEEPDRDLLLPRQPERPAEQHAEQGSGGELQHRQDGQGDREFRIVLPAVYGELRGGAEHDRRKGQDVPGLLLPREAGVMQHVQGHCDHHQFGQYDRAHIEGHGVVLLILMHEVQVAVWSDGSEVFF